MYDIKTFLLKTISDLLLQRLRDHCGGGGGKSKRSKQRAPREAVFYRPNTGTRLPQAQHRQNSNTQREVGTSLTVRSCWQETAAGTVIFHSGGPW